MSVLDMFASALGAFIMVAIILFPYYQKNKPIMEKLDSEIAELTRLKDEVTQTNAQAEKIEQQNLDIKLDPAKIQLAQNELNRCKQGMEACLIELGTTFLLVKIDWDTSADVDLHVTDPEGNEFFFFNTNRDGQSFQNSNGRLSTDTAQGPGVEVWQIPAVSKGDYKIEYVLESPTSWRTAVRGLFFDKTGKREIPAKILGPGQSRVLAGFIQVDEQGKVSLR